KEVSVIVPSGSEEWKLVKVKDIESNKKRYSAEFGFRIGEFRGEVLSDQRRPSITFYTPFANVDAEETWGIFEAAPDQAAECPGSRHSRYSLLVRPFKEVAFEYFDVTWLPQVGVARQQPGSEGSQK
ncbi:MAG: hypothetical protein DMG96_36640, partial [Acidobacteria bacterium]